jgi:hypothetical protein
VWCSELLYAADHELDGSCPRLHFPVRATAGVGGRPWAAVCGRVDRAGPGAKGGSRPSGSAGASSRSAVGAAAGAAGGYGRRLVVDRYRAVGATAPQALGVYEESPLATTFVRVLVAVDIAAMDAALTTWMTGRHAPARAQQPAGTTAAERRTVLAVDGKTLRGSKDADGRQTKMVCVYDHARRLVLTQSGVAGGDEVAVFTIALTSLPDLADVLVNGDALKGKRALAEYLAVAAGSTSSPSRATSRCLAKR